ncbi:hypothetical protein [Entomospira culicis]|uniref:Uncharacterized protein n=1 Tax=Entomospira culicis TaxID=2719989 RepID=A0A968GGH1_9SPIO|nr:hypothetical protein [Entomospira culicis]NIZ19937.1 hypothetical protein [Entomospira culicis]NIZ70106.1 hypothetical protein [Entomospira culicis]WDI38033.1 hypothetical protein PVA46_07795 [Entomospira culicis]WDI39656.1 hypothetical protein PVA47_07795 [Entomospira culicis]
MQKIYTTFFLTLLLLTTVPLHAGILGHNVGLRGSLDLANGRGNSCLLSTPMDFDSPFKLSGGFNLFYDLVFESSPNGYGHWSVGSAMQFNFARKSFFTALDTSIVEAKWNEMSLEATVKYHMLMIFYAGLGGGVVYNTKAKFSHSTFLPADPISVWSLHPTLHLELGGNIPVGPAILQREYRIYLNIATKASINPLAFKPAKGVFASPASINLFVGAVLGPSVIG